MGTYFGNFRVLLSVLVFQARAADFLLKDTIFQHGADAQSRPYAYFPVSGSPANWSSPANYAGGMGYFRLEVLDKPSDVIVRYQPCLEQDGRTSGRRACAAYSEFVDPGIYTWSQALSQWTQTNMDWVRNPQELRLAMLDGYGVAVNPTATNWVGTPHVALYYPMRLRFSQMMVSSGSAFPGWNLPPTPVLPRIARRLPALSWNPVDRRVTLRFAPGGRGRSRSVDIQGRTLSLPLSR